MASPSARDLVFSPDCPAHHAKAVSRRSMSLSSPIVQSGPDALVYRLHEQMSYLLPQHMRIQRTFTKCSMLRHHALAGRVPNLLA